MNLDEFFAEARRLNCRVVSDDPADLRTALDGLAAVANARSQYVTALRLAREGYASEAATGLPVLPQWRERVMALIDDALKG